VSPSNRAREKSFFFLLSRRPLTFLSLFFDELALVPNTDLLGSNPYDMTSFSSGPACVRVRFSSVATSQAGPELAFFSPTLLCMLLFICPLEPSTTLLGDHPDIFFFFFSTQTEGPWWVAPVKPLIRQSIYLPPPGLPLPPGSPLASSFNTTHTRVVFPNFRPTLPLRGVSPSLAK